MSLIEQHIVDTCRTAADVRAAAQRVVDKRRESMPKLVKLVRRVEAELAPRPETITEIAHEIIVDETVDTCGPVTIRKIQMAVCKKWKLDIVDLLSGRKTKSIAFPRHISFVLCRALTLRSFPEIGRRHGGRDHTTVMHGIRKYEWLLVALRAELQLSDPLSVWVNRAFELVDA